MVVICDLCAAEISEHALAAALEVLVFSCGHVAHACLRCRALGEHREAPNGEDAFIAKLRATHAVACKDREAAAERDAYRVRMALLPCEPVVGPMVCIRVPDHEGDHVFALASDPFYVDGSDQCFAPYVAISSGEARGERVHAGAFEMAAGTPVPEREAIEAAFEFAGEGFEGIDRSVAPPLSMKPHDFLDTMERAMREMPKWAAPLGAFGAAPPRPGYMLPANAPASLVAACEGRADEALRLRAEERAIEAAKAAQARTGMLRKIEACRCNWPVYRYASADGHASNCPASALVAWTDPEIR